MAETLTQLRNRFRWDASAQRFRGPGGSFVSETSMTRALRDYAGKTAADFNRLAAQVSDGSITVEAWQERVRDRLRDLHLSQSAAAKGGFHRLTKSDYGRIGNRLRSQFSYLKKFAKDVASGRLSGQAIAARSRQYVSAGRNVYEAERYRGWRDRATTGVGVLCRNVLGGAEHCSAKDGKPGCIEESARGWVPIALMSLPGSRTCRVHCACQLRFKTVSPS